MADGWQPSECKTASKDNLTCSVVLLACHVICLFGSYSQQCAQRATDEIACLHDCTDCTVEPTSSLNTGTYTITLNTKSQCKQTMRKRHITPHSTEQSVLTVFDSRHAMSYIQQHLQGISHERNISINCLLSGGEAVDEHS